ncbi:hypothetical protein [Dysgonomonas reticulitermitis]
MKLDIYLLILLLLCFSCKENIQKDIDTEINKSFDSLQNKLDSVFDKGMFLKNTTRQSFLYENINNLLNKYINERFYQKIDTKSFRNEKLLEYTKDTFRIQETVRFCQERDYSTLRMSLCNIYREEAEMKLVNKYYEKLLLTIDSDEKKLLIESQNKWIESYQSDKEFSDLLLSKEEGTMYSILQFTKPEYRIQFLFDCLLY